MTTFIAAREHGGVTVSVNGKYPFYWQGKNNQSTYEEGSKRNHQDVKHRRVKWWWHYSTWILQTKRRWGSICHRCHWSPRPSMCEEGGDLLINTPVHSDASFHFSSLFEHLVLSMQVKHSYRSKNNKLHTYILYVNTHNTASLVINAFISKEYIRHLFSFINYHALGAEVITLTYSVVTWVIASTVLDYSIEKGVEDLILSAYFSNTYSYTVSIP